MLLIIPKRLMRPLISMSYWEGRLTLSNWGFPAEKEEAAS